MPYEEEEDESIEFGAHAAKKGVIFVGGQITVAIVSMLMLIILARLLQPDAFGLYTIAIAFNGIITIASNFGMGTAFRKMIPEMQKPDRKLVNLMLSNGYFVAISLGTIIAVVALLSSNYFAVTYYHNPALAVPMQLAALAELITILFSLTQGALVGLNLVRNAAIANASYSIANLIASVSLVLLGYGVTGALIGLLVGLSVGAIIGISAMVRRGFRWVAPQKAMIKRLTKFTGPVVASYIAMQGAQNFSILLLGIYAATAVVGNFGAAYKLARFVELTITSITFILVGTYSAALARKETANRIGQIYNKSIFYSALFLFPLIAYTIAVTQPLSTVLFTTQYAMVPFFFAFMVAGMALGMIGNYAGTLVIGHGDTKRYMKYQVVAVLVQLALLYIFVPYYQAYGVLLATYLITPIFLNLLYMRALEKQFSFKHELAGVAKIAVLSIILCALMFLIATVMNQSKWSILVDGIVVLLLFPPLAGMTKSISRENIEFVNKTAAKLKQLGIFINWIAKYAYIFVRE